MTHIAKGALALLVSLTVCLGKEGGLSGRFPVVVAGKYGYIDRAGNLVIKPQFDSAANFADGLGRVRVAGKWGYVEPSGRLAIAARYEDARDFSEGLGTVYLRDSAGAGWAIINKTGRAVVRSRFNWPMVFHEGRAWFAAEDFWSGCINRKGDTVIRPEFPYEDRPFSEGLAYVRMRGRHGFIDTTGRAAIEADFDWAGDFHEGLAYFMDDSAAPGRWGYINRSGEVVLKPQFEKAGDFSGGLAPVSVSGKWGYINRTGKAVVVPQFVEAHAFSEGLALVRVVDTHPAGPAKKDIGWYGPPCYGYIDRTGAMVIEPQFDRARDFSDGLAEVWVGDRTRARTLILPDPSPPPTFRHGYINKRGAYVWEAIEQSQRKRSW